jgi:hypothetical protein
LIRKLGERLACVSSYYLGFVGDCSRLYNCEHVAAQHFGLLLISLQRDVQNLTRREIEAFVPGFFGW